MLTAYAVQFLTNASLMVVIVYIPLLARGYGASSQQIGLLVACYQAMTLVSSIVFGRWGDYGDRKKFVVAGLVAATVALTLHASARNLGGLFAARALAGACVGIFPAALMAYFYNRSKLLGRYT